MASFKLAEKESDRLLFRGPLKNRSAESSPMTTLQKNTHMQHLFSSHSSPSNSYNKYVNKVSSPPGTIQKSVKSPTSSIKKSYCSPANAPMPLHARGAPEGSSGRAAATAATPKVSPMVADHRYSENKDDADDVDQSQIVHDYANMKMSKDGVMGVSTVLEAQRKVSAASAGGKGLVSRERRNSFREAVEKGKEEESKDERGRYESIWFQKDGRGSKSGGENNGGRTSPSQRRHHHHHHHHKRSSHNQRAEPQKTPSRQDDEANSRQQPLRPYHQQYRDHRQQVRSRHAISGNYENVGPSAVDNGYEPVNFKDGAADTPPHQLQSVGLVAEVVNRSQRHSQPASMPSFDTGRAANGKANPPPYKEPPQPSTIYNKQRYDVGPRHQQHQQQQPIQQQYDHYQSQSYAHRSPQKPFQTGKTDSILPTKENSNSYVNVHVNRRGGAMETGRQQTILPFLLELSRDFYSKTVVQPRFWRGGLLRGFFSFS